MTAELFDSMINELGAFFVTRDEIAQIAQTTLTGSVASVTFASIPQHFRSLFLIYQARSDLAAELDVVLVRLNADAGNNYDWIRQFGRADGATGVTGARGVSSMTIGWCEAANSRASVFTPALIYLAGYSSASVEKVINSCPHSVYGNRNANTDIYMILAGGAWRNTNAVTSITILPQTGPNFVSGSIFQLYGLA